MKSAEEWTFIQGNYPRLPLINVYAELDEANEAHLINLLRENSAHFMGVGIHFPTRRLLSKLNVGLPNLSSLFLTGLSQDYSNHDVVHIEGLKRFNFESKSKDQIPTEIDLHQIKKLALKIPFKLSKKWFNFLENQVNRRLSELDLKTNEITKEQLLAISKHLPNLEAVDVELKSHFAINDIVEFMEKEKKLKRLTLIADIKKLELEKLEEVLTDKWSVEYDHSFETYVVNLER